jgi:leader peptidase (prepilin peptidase)/N-methyltransferase
MDAIGLLQSSPVFLVTMTTLLGLLVGSFLNVVIHRLPIIMQREWHSQCRELLDIDSAEDGQTEEYNLVRPRSACPSCKAPIKSWQNIPVISYVMLKGKCAACGASISARYPIIEAFTGLISALVAWHFGFGWEMLLGLIFSWTLIALSVIDIDHQLLPDSMTQPLLWLGLALSLWHTDIDGMSLVQSPAAAIIGALAGYLSLWSVYQLFKLLTGKEGMGYGDFKLLAALGAWLGWKTLPLIVILSALVGAVVGITLIAMTGRGRHKPIPFGPFLAAAGWIAMMWGDILINRYLAITGLQ